MTTEYDIVIVGGGHNGLTAAAYLANAGKRVIVLEQLDSVGGAAVSAQSFEGVEAQLSRYSYLVSLLPARIIGDLGLKLQLRRRRYSSYTPRPGFDDGVLIDEGDARATAAALGQDAAAWEDFYDGTARLARSLFPTVTEPLLTRSEARRALGDDALWESLIENPIGATISGTFRDDLVRGVVLTDALIGTFAPNVDPTLAGNRCFLYHVIGNETGNWDVPVGGMGAVSAQLLDAARRAGAEIVTGAEVVAIDPGGEVAYRRGEAELTVAGAYVLANVAPYVLEQLMGGPSTSSGTKAEPKPEGAQVKVNLLLGRLPKLRDTSVDPSAAFGGTFHINELWSQLDAAYTTAAVGSIPNPLPCEIYCHSLTDPSILSPELRESGAQTMTVFGLHAPDRLVTESTNDARRSELQAAAVASLNSVLAEPIEDLLLTDALGRPTIETKTTLDIEHALGMPGGNIFHQPLSWPFLEDDAPRSTAAERWGVATRHPRILICGSGAQRGGAVSGIGGHNAAMAILESDG
ncbi:MAG TPA: NAD(P)/FAD-dependent oxidoreductase [Galbitalea sp.]|jgi:phytoene dehydrogenase-like protein|nr:NAD(P)/FAD-dependent oxidoreductase [Galbitalea sp.]